MSDYVSFDSSSVAKDSYPVTPSDGADLPKPCRALRANGGGIVSVTTASGNRRSMNFLDGETRFVAVTKVWLDGTTATEIEGMP